MFVTGHGRAGAVIAGHVLVMGLLAGCGAGQSAPPAPPTETDYVVLKRAELLIIRDCMQKHGFRYWVPKMWEPSRGFGFVLDDPDWAREHGYGGLDQHKAMQAKRDDPNIAYRASLPASRRTQYALVMSGGDDVKVLTAHLPDGGTINNALGGCELSSSEELYGNHERWFRLDRLASNIAPLYMREIAKDARFVAALSSWSRCMRGKGHAYATPPEIRAALPGLTGGLAPAQAHTVEVKLAVAEATCARATSLPSTLRALRAEYQPKVEGPYAASLRTHARLLREALDRAKEINHATPWLPRHKVAERPSMRATKERSMRKIHFAAAAVSLAVAAVPMSSPSWADSAALASHCRTQKDLYNEDGTVTAYSGTSCHYPLGYDGGNDANWADQSGEFTGSAGNNAMSILNTGKPGGYDVVAVYDYENQWAGGGYRCLGVGDWVSDLSQSRFVDPNGNIKGPMARQISSHQWVPRSACTTASMIG
ncbi:hypothetical protein [Nonomuraea insulae]|uniref:Uncharacterized protein n=1 Tax=Nonomuraea insulae TaxID=1616787 RepID=A0ABW1CT51_9ACTN